MFYYTQQIIEEAATILKQGCVIVDLETTGFSSDPQVAIVEVAVVNQDGEVLLNTLIKPGRRIPAEATGVHGLTNNDVAGAPAFETIYDQLAPLLHKKTVVAYNYTFEAGILDRVCMRLKLPPITPSHWYCAMRKYAQFRGSRRWFRLGVACHHEGIPIENAHRALGDCMMTLALLRKMARL